LLLWQTRELFDLQDQPQRGHGGCDITGRCGAGANPANSTDAVNRPHAAACSAHSLISGLTLSQKAFAVQSALLEPFDSLSDWNLSFLK
jgi:hypothetical protein